VRVAQFKSLKYDYITVSAEGLDGADEYIRVSEYIDVDFVERDPRETIEQEVDTIDKQIQTVQAAAQVKLNELEQRKNDLLALEDMT